jgi:hypothetical protein
VSDGSKRFTYQAFDGGRHHELSSKEHLLHDPTWAEQHGSSEAAYLRKQKAEVTLNLLCYYIKL